MQRLAFIQNERNNMRIKALIRLVLCAASFATVPLVDVQAFTIVNFSLPGLIDAGPPDGFLFGYVIATPFRLPDGIPVSVASMAAITLTPSTGGAATTIAPLIGYSRIMQNYIGSCDAGVDIGTPFSSSATLPVTHTFKASNTFIPSPGCDSLLTVVIDFQGSGYGAIYGAGPFIFGDVVAAGPASDIPAPTFSGWFEVTTIGEPASAALVAAAVLATVGFGRRRSRAAA